MSDEINKSVDGSVAYGSVVGPTTPIKPKYYIDDKPMLSPDANVQFSYEDIDDADSGRDEAGEMHRIRLRSNVMSATFEYSMLTYEEYLYMESLFKGKEDFAFTMPLRLPTDGSAVDIKKCYRAKHSIVVMNAYTGMCRNYKFTIIEC